MAKDDLYAFQGVILKCDKGATVLPLLTTPKKHAVSKLQIATVTDNVPIVNIPSFGVCSITGSACIPVAPEWLKAHDGAQKVLGQAPLLFSSYCKCQAGGTIEIFKSTEDAKADLERDKESRVDGIPWLDGALGSALTSPIGPILDAFTDGGEDVTQGVGRGFRAGLKGTWNGLVQMVSHPVETAKGLTKMVGIAVVGYGTQSPTGQFSTPEQRLKDFDSVFGTDLAPTHEAIGDAIADGWDKKVVNGTTEERSEVVGQVYEGVLEAVVGTKGAGAAVKGITTAGKFVIGADRLAEITAAIAKLQKAMKLEALASKVTGIFKVGVRPKVITNLMEDILKLKKPLHSPDIAKWFRKGGKIEVLDDGTWRYIDWEGNKVRYINGSPDFGPHSRQSVNIGEQKGNYTTDYSDAERLSNKKPPKLDKEETVWHHHEDGKTMQEVDRTIHDRFTHQGGVSNGKKVAFGKK
ncbi:PAAR-like protein [Pedobacter sp. GR22-10]|uniref:PAAR-like protein n=1 Tax=Pedobacter sp. GR22-10 TaxID=2994472 RepID=UPI002245C9B3|nr:PAAR-like protein [Pedobacter sp. GR22-10]MCX2429253.1 PAAR-like protein [Pedobacter sp. GR22-10]